MARIQLDARQAVDIYMMHLCRTKGLSTRLAKKYGVHPKTIRDIWNRVSWTEHTSKYWGTSCADVVSSNTFATVLNRVVNKEPPFALWPGCVPPHDLNRVASEEPPLALWPGCVPPHDPFADDFPYWIDE